MYIYLSALPEEFVENLRNFNTFGGIVAVLLLLFLRIRPYWSSWATARRLITMAATLFCFSVAYGSYEILYMTTNYRVPMITVSIVWAITATVWPSDERDRGNRKR